ncbi:MAG: hypothetical protein K0S37_1112 [Microbacterium sp.]|nr:hypothetical protein [Microbacterium sp.]
MPTAKTSQLTSGDELEARTAQVWFWEGYYSRYGIDLTNHYGAELIQVTDLDLLASAFGPALEVRKTIGESKSGGRSAPKPLDRIVWLSGLQNLVGANQAELTIKAAPTSRVRELGRHLNVTVQSIADLTAREDDIDLRAVADTGAHGAGAMQLRKTVQAISRNDPFLESAYRYLTSTVWFLDVFSATKQTLGLARTLAERWTPGVKDDDHLAMRWLISEAVSLLGYNIVAIAGHVRPMSSDAFNSYLRERLADGIVPAQKMRVLARDIDKYISGVLTAANAPATIRTQAIGAFEPSPPDWADSLAELALRLRRIPNIADLPRQLDLLVYERLARGRTVPADAASRLRLADPETTVAIRTLAAFLRNYQGITNDVSDLITAPVADPKPASSAAIAGLDQGALFDLSEAHIVKDETGSSS